MFKTFLSKPLAACFIFTAITLISLFISRNIQLGESKDNRYAVFSIRFEYFGMDAAEMERVVTIPLEEKIAALSDLYEIQSSSEYGKSITTLYFDRSINEKNTYLALRDAVDTLYNILPEAVQKPRIYSTAAEQKAIFSIACVSDSGLNTLRKYVENTLKKDFERVPGVAEVIVTGGTINEIRVEFDAGKVSEIGMNPAALGGIIRDANVVSPGGVLYGPAENKPLVLDTKIRSLDQIKHLPVNAGDEIISLEYFADIQLLPRESDEIVRINGRECIGVQIKTASNANIIKISSDCKKVIKASSIPEDSVRILSDSGETLFSAIRNVFLCLAQSFIAIAILIPLFFKTAHVMVLLLVLLPVNCIWTCAVLYLFGFSLDQNVLSGITISLGLVIDSALIIAVIAENHTEFQSYGKAVSSVTGAIVASALTTICVLIPLYFLDYIVPGIKSISVTITVMMANSLVITCIFFPCFVFSKTLSKPVIPPGLFNKLRKCYVRISYRLCICSLKYSKTTRAIYVICMIMTFTLFFISGKNITLGTENAILYAAVEYEPEQTGASIDRDLTGIAGRIREEYGVAFLRMESRNGTAELEIGFDEKLITRQKLADNIAALPPYLQNGFLYVPDAGGKKQTGLQEIQIAAAGDEIAQCRETARQGAAAAQMIPRTIQTVLNFKNPEKIARFSPDRPTVSKSGLTVETIASALRWSMFGPVVDKWIQNGEEIDIRVAGKNLKNTKLSNLANLYIPTENDSVRLETLGALEISEGTGKIYRRDGRRAAYFTAHMAAASTSEAVRLIKSALTAVDTEKGYGFLLPRELELLEHQYRLLLFAFLGSIAAILLLLTALTENFIKSLVITSIIPVSCLFPLLLKYITRSPLEMGDIVGMVIISGISVNNAIYIAESKKSSVIFKIREKIRSILVTSLTGILAAMPLVFMKSGGFSKTLALSILLGTAGSLFAALVLFPAVYGVIRDR
jgi:HAE1 family hydrophobic/amphiphilic exporter-1